MKLHVYYYQRPRHCDTLSDTETLAVNTLCDTLIMITQFSKTSAKFINYVQKRSESSNRLDTV